ncbi:nitrate/nitrite transporter [Mycobacterium sp. pUA109]|uniref:nitrate/nitrite transporter n=1 Tax=Mycobacterium sp. pUA109 TaxID=3238982 RepID=UPI00351B5527
MHVPAQQRSSRLKASRRQTANLMLATWVSTINFWAWNMIGPLAPMYAGRLSLSSAETSLLVAAPILVGSLGRVAIGSRTDRVGGRIMFTVVSVVSILPVVGVGAAATAGSYAWLLMCGFLLGIAGTIFAVGIPFANSWYEPLHRGFATGIFGMGMAGVALSAFFTPRLVQRFGLLTTHTFIAVSLVANAVLCSVFMRNGPYFVVDSESGLRKLVTTIKLPVTWEMSFLYAVVFGAFMAFSNYLPVYIKNIYGSSTVDAGTRTAGFALAAVLARPLGGAASDRLQPKYVVLASLGGIAVLSCVAICEPPPDLWSGATFLTLAVFFGVGTGGVFAWVPRRARATSLGSMTGIVSAAGGLGGFFPPLIMGATYDPCGIDYTVGLLLLVMTVLVAFGYAAVRLPARDGA